MQHPKIDFPGTWRWKDSYFTEDTRKVKIQQKVGLFWITRADAIYWPNGRGYLTSQGEAIDICNRNVIRFWNQNRPREIHPA